MHLLELLLVMRGEEGNFFVQRGREIGELTGQSGLMMGSKFPDLIFVFGDGLIVLLHPVAGLILLEGLFPFVGFLPFPDFLLEVDLVDGFFC
jgi:hypothetical protein